MRIRTVELSWFRGAADSALLQLDCKSAVIYGNNGSGKSCFVDAVEYLIRAGRIEHLAHEYSGKRQEKGVLNTHRPPNEKARITITLGDQSVVHCEIGDDGTCSIDGAGAAELTKWEYHLTVLRQHELARFILDTKGNKYSSLLPLLGLGPLETTAENLRQLTKCVESEANLQDKLKWVRDAESKAHSLFETAAIAQIETQIRKLSNEYCQYVDLTIELSELCDKVRAIIADRIEEATPDQRRYVALRSIAEQDILSPIKTIRKMNDDLAKGAEPLIMEQLNVLEATRAYIDKVDEEGTVKCPACGQHVAVDHIEIHITSEQERLNDLITIYNRRKAEIATLCGVVQSLRGSVQKTELKDWIDGLDEPLAAISAVVGQTDIEKVRSKCDEDVLSRLQGIQDLIDLAERESRKAPAEVSQLSIDRELIDAAKALCAARDVAAEVHASEKLISILKSIELRIRAEIKKRAQEIVDEISADIQAMWEILHPKELIENVRLHFPLDVNKAIDIHLKFYGIEQESPRLTLSEGYRNSLGLCIFLAMAKRETASDSPLFLDDVVVSFDRSHRGMVSELIEREFPDRQVIMFTHDRDWFGDLRVQLQGKGWLFRSLRPYDSPSTGIRWSDKESSFDEARAFLKDRPDTAGNDARKIMDVELAFAAEKLRIRLPFVRGEKNEKRTAHEFITRIASDARKCFQKRIDHAEASYTVHDTGIERLMEADKLLVSWGNRASHSNDLVKTEATKLIDTCEAALEVFNCPYCGKSLWYADATNQELLQCQCGQIRWRYGKG